MVTMIGVVLDQYPEVLGIANDVNTLIDMTTALREGKHRRAVWKAFLLGIAFATYLRLLLDLLDDDDDDDDDGDNHETVIDPKEPPSGDFTEPVPVRYLRQVLEHNHFVH
jgi:hypothetical protein